MNTLYVINLVFCAVIVIVGLMGWRQSKKSFLLYLSIASALFGLSYLSIFFGVASMEAFMIVTRVAAYLIVLFTLYKAGFGSK